MGKVEQGDSGTGYVCANTCEWKGSTGPAEEKNRCCKGPRSGPEELQHWMWGVLGRQAMLAGVRPAEGPKAPTSLLDVG